MNEHSKLWPLQEAKAKFSELLRRAKEDGPQVVTVHGKPFASIVAIDLDHPTEDNETGQIIVDAFKKCPVKDFEIPRVRDFGPFREPES